MACDECGTDHEGYPDGSLGAVMRCMRARAARFGRPAQLMAQIEELERRSTGHRAFPEGPLPADVPPLPNPAWARLDQLRDSATRWHLVAAVSMGTCILLTAASVAVYFAVDGASASTLVLALIAMVAAVVALAASAAGHDIDAQANEAMEANLRFCPACGGDHSTEDLPEVVEQCVARQALIPGSRGTLARAMLPGQASYTDHHRGEAPPW